MKIKLTNDNFNNDFSMDLFDPDKIFILKNINDNIAISGNRQIFINETLVDDTHALIEIDNRFNTNITISRDYAIDLIESIYVFYND